MQILLIFDQTKNIKTQVLVIMAIFDRNLKN